MATARIKVDRLLLIKKCEELNAQAVKTYEADLKVYEKAKAAFDKKVSTYSSKLLKALSSQGFERVSANTYNGEVSFYFDKAALKAVIEDIGEAPRMESHKPEDPRKFQHYQSTPFKERLGMIETALLSTAAEITLPVSWSEQYLR